MNLIIGAGVTGLSFAAFSKNKDYIIIEKEQNPGGYCNTIYKDGFIWDYSGHFFHFRNENIKNFILSKINKEDILKIKKQTQIKYKNRYIDFPFQKNIHQLEKSEFIDCLYDLYFRKNKNYSNFKEMVYFKYGKSISEKFLIPYNEKVYACNLDSLDSEAMGRFFPHANINEIIKNFKNSSNNSYNSNFIYPKGGSIQYIEALKSSIDSSKISLDEELLSIDLEKKIAKTNKREIKYDNIISSIPFTKLLMKCGIQYNKDIYNWNKVLVFNFGFDGNNNNMQNHWIYYPEKGYCFYRVGFYNNILSQDRMSLYVEIGFKKHDKIDIEKERKQVLNDLRKAEIVTNQNVIAESVIIMDLAYIHVNIDSQKDVSEKLKELRNHAVYSIGRYGGWKYCSIEDNIIEAKEIAELINKR